MIRAAALLAAVGAFGAATFYAVDVVHRIRPHRLWEFPDNRGNLPEYETPAPSTTEGDDGFVVDLFE